MSESTCSIEGCEAPAFCRRWCPTHYQRWKKHGDPLRIGAPGRPRVPPKKRTPRVHVEPIDRLIASRVIVIRHFPGSRVPPDSPCWESTYKPSTAGYAVIGDGGKTLYAYHLSYDKWVGERDKDRQIDHACCNRACWNPEHLKQMTQKENIALGNSPGAVATRTGLCKYGHSLDDAYIVKATGYRNCRVCRQESQRKYDATRHRS